MKRKIAYSLVFCLLAGCAWLQTAPDRAETIVAKIAARRIGTYLAQHRPEAAVLGAQLAQAIITTGDLATIQVFVKFLSACTTDPALAADISDLLSILDLDEPGISPKRKVLFQQVAGAFCEGINIGRGT